MGMTLTQEDYEGMQLSFKHINKQEHTIIRLLCFIILVVFICNAIVFIYHLFKVINLMLF
jgi:hypothetical protein